MLGFRGATPKDVHKLVGVRGPTQCKGCEQTLGTRARAEQADLGVLGGLDGQFHEKISTTVGDPPTPTHPQGYVQTNGGQWTHPKKCCLLYRAPYPQEQGADAHSAPVHKAAVYPEVSD